MRAPPGIQRAWTADPDLIRRLDVGQACYIPRGAATFVQVARPSPSPLTLLPAAPGPGEPGARLPGPAGTRPPPAQPTGRLDLDDLFGPGAAR